MADGLFYNDIRTPFITSDLAAVTLTTTDKALYTAFAFPVLGQNYWGFAGKKLSVRLSGAITTAVTPGNGTFDIYWGSGVDATGNLLASSPALTLAASKTNLLWMVEVWVLAKTIGTSGSLFCSGTCDFDTVVQTTGGGVIMPTAQSAVTVDTTVSNIISVQFKRSGSTVETMKVQDMEVIAYN